MKRPSGRCTRGGVGTTRRSSCDERPSLIRPFPLNRMPTLEGRLCSQYFSTGVSGVPPSRPTPPNSKGRRVAPVVGKSGLGRLQRRLSTAHTHRGHSTKARCSLRSGISLIGSATASVTIIEQTRCRIRPSSRRISVLAKRDLCPFLNNRWRLFALSSLLADHHLDANNQAVA
jgi:hypothetical protein